MMSKNIYLHTLGCAKNMVDSENLKRKLMMAGFKVDEETVSPANEETASTADIILINTCGFIEDAKRESINEILRLSGLKSNGTKLLVFGCLAQRYTKELKQEIPEIDEIQGVGGQDKIVEYCIRESGAPANIARVTNPNIAGVTDPFLPVPASKLAAGRACSYAYLKIAEGCDRRCSYCIIPSIRGPFRSLPPHKILHSAEAIIRAGKKELILVSQDLTSYGKDLNGYDLKDLLKDIASISGDFWIRLLYLNPSSVTDSLIRLMSEVDKICNYLDIPLQHSEDRILRLMKRGGSKQLYRRLIKKIRDAMPDAALRSTFIVGFPQEEEEDFKRLKDFVEEIGFDRLGAFKYSKQEGTPSASMKGHLGEGIKKKRLDELMRLQSKISLEKNKGLIGRKMKALSDEPGIARIYSQSPEIDGVVLLEGLETPLMTGHASRIAGGHAPFVNIKITDAMDYDLIGVIDPWVNDPFYEAVK